MKKIQAFDLGIYNPHQMSNVKLAVNKVKKDKEIFFTEDFFNENDRREWEVRYDNSYPNVFYDYLIGKYRCYYSTFTKDESSSNYSLEERKNKNYEPHNNRVVSLCYAESDDGINWFKPNLGLVEWNGSKNNNIIGHYLHGTSILLDTNELDDSKRYKMFTKIDYGNGIHYMAVCFSKDGINFNNFIKCNNFNPRGDTHNSVIYDQSINKYVLITRIWRDSMRMPVISYSSDFINWSRIEDILPSRSYYNQIYSMPFFIDGEYKIGLASMHHEGDRLDENFDNIDVELTYSLQYKGWNYVDPGNPFIENGVGNYINGEFDNGCIFTSLPVKIDNKLYFYYMGGNGQHTNYRETSFSRAYIEFGRYAYLEQKKSNYEGVVYTNDFVFLKNSFFVDAEIEEGGYINIDFVDQYNNEIIKNSNVEIVKYGDKYKISFDKKICNSKIQLRIKFKKAKIFSYEGNLDIFRIENSSSLLRD